MSKGKLSNYLTTEPQLNTSAHSLTFPRTAVSRGWVPAYTTNKAMTKSTALRFRNNKKLLLPYHMCIPSGHPHTYTDTYKHMRRGVKVSRRQKQEEQFEGNSSWQTTARQQDCFCYWFRSDDILLACFSIQLFSFSSSSSSFVDCNCKHDPLRCFPQWRQKFGMTNSASKNETEANVQHHNTRMLPEIPHTHTNTPEGNFTSHQPWNVTVFNEFLLECHRLQGKLSLVKLINKARNSE